MNKSKFPGYYWRLIKTKIIDFFYKITSLGLDLETMRKKGLFPKTCCVTNAFKVFMKVVKEGHLILTKERLMDDKYLVYQFDFVGENFILD